MKPTIMEVNAITNAVINREMTDEEFAQYTLQQEKIAVEEPTND